MALWKPDPTFYPSAVWRWLRRPRRSRTSSRSIRSAANPTHYAPSISIPSKAAIGKVVGRLEMPKVGDELHHLGWNACSAALCPYAPHPHIERRYLVAPGLRSSRINIIDTKPSARNPRIVRITEPEEIASKAGYSRPHTIHCGPDAIYVSARGATNGDGPGGIFLLDHESFDILGRWEVDRGPQQLAYDFWWHLGWDVVVTSGTTFLTGAIVTIVHTSAMLLVMGTIAIVIYEKVGLAILRSASNSTSM
jgi:methanethiol oxidase